MFIVSLVAFLTECRMVGVNFLLPKEAFLTECGARDDEHISMLPREAILTDCRVFVPLFSTKRYNPNGLMGAVCNIVLSFIFLFFVSFLSKYKKSGIRLHSVRNASFGRKGAGLTIRIPLECVQLFFNRLKYISFIIFQIKIL